MLDRIRSLVGPGRYPAEIAFAIMKAVQLKEDYRIPDSAVADFWPADYSYDGIKLDKPRERVRVDPVPPVKVRGMDARAFADWLNQMAYARRQEKAEAKAKPEPKPEPKPEQDWAKEAREKSKARSEAHAARRANSSDRSRARAEASVNAKPGTIGHYANQLFLERPYPGREKQGWSYTEVLAKIADRFPGNRSTLTSIKWYESKLRVMGHDVPRREK